MRTVSVREARQKLRSLLDDVAAGEEVVLMRRGKAVARLVPDGDAAQRLPSPEERARSLQQRLFRRNDEFRAVDDELCQRVTTLRSCIRDS